MSASDTPRAVFDCMVFLQAIARPNGPAARLFVEFVEAGHLTLFVSDAILAEVRDVLARPRIRTKNPAVTDDSVRDFLERVQTVGQMINAVPTLFQLTRDPDDEPYINLAILTSANYLVTRDNDLLDLMQEPEFLAYHPTLAILDPVALLQILKSPAE